MRTGGVLAVPAERAAGVLEGGDAAGGAADVLGGRVTGALACGGAADGTAVPSAGRVTGVPGIRLGGSGGGSGSTAGRRY